MLTVPLLPLPSKPVEVVIQAILPVPVQVVYPLLFVHCDILPPLLVNVCELLAVVVPVQDVAALI